MEKNLKISNLLDFYADLLTENQRRVLTLYYNEDFSLTEIAEILKITRQGVHDTIKKAVMQLFELENKLKLSRKFNDIKKNLQVIIESSEELSALSKNEFEKIKCIANSIKNAAKLIYNVQ